jgi:hypothetical protein
MRQVLPAVLAGVVAFVACAVLMIQLMPDPLSDSDYLVIGSVSTLVALLSVFLVLVSTKMRASDVFFKKRKKQKPL